MKVLSVLLVLICSVLSVAEVRIRPELKIRPRDKSALLEGALAQFSLPLHETRAFKDEPPKADLVFGPLNTTSELFQIAIVECNRPQRNSWQCGPPKYQHFAYLGTTNRSIRYHEGVPPPVAVAVLKEAEANCDMYFNDSFVFMPELRSSKKPNEYRLYGGGCTHTFIAKGKEATIGEPFNFLE